ncbi:MAG TPA: hypothetical protein ACFCUY_13815 [Xenococcaceae cyanobacterium]
MAKKRRLSDLIGEETEQIESTTNESVTAEVSESVTNEVTELQTTKVRDSKNIGLPNQQTHELSDSATNEVPKYLTLIRKEARLREDQLDNLTSLTRSLNRKRKGAGERITENTLIRVAIDLLINQSGELKGATEQEIKKSVGLEVTD